jgi:hypothetical protein
MQSGPKKMAANFRGLARVFGGMRRKWQSLPIEDIALDYHEAAKRAGTLLVEAYRTGLLPGIPGLPKLVSRGLDEARLFKQFHGYEVNTAVLLSGHDESQPGNTGLTCGLLPQLLPDHPAFQPQSYRGKSSDQQALLTELRRAQEACKWLAAQITGRVNDKSPAAKTGSAGKKAVARRGS